MRLTALLAAPVAAPLAAAVVLSAGAASAAPACRVLLNYSQPAVGGAQSRVLDLQIGPASKVTEVKDAHAVYSAGKLYHVRERLQYRQTVGTAGNGMPVSTKQQWSTVRLNPVGGGSAVTLLAAFPSLALPTEDDVTDTFDAEHIATLQGIFNGYLSYSISRGGFAGGAHGYDDSGWATYLAPGTKPVNVAKLIGPEGIKAAAAQMVADNKAREEPFSDPPVANATSLASAGFSLRPDGVNLAASVYCCTWAENHNLYELKTPLPAAPKAIATAVPDAKGWFTSACGAFKPTKSGIEVKVSGATQTIAANTGGWLVGVSWVTGEAPALTAAKPDAVGHAGALDAGRKFMGGKDYTSAVRYFDVANSLRPGDARTLSEAGWARFKAKDLKGAKVNLNAALAAAQKDSVKGAIYYNLGRVAEAAGELANARQAYEASLKARPGNKTVKSRLEGLAKP